MLKMRLTLIILLLAGLLSLGQPGMAAVNSDTGSTPPALTFSQNKNNNLLVEHDFVYDDGILVPAGDSDVDGGIYIRIP